MRDFRLLDETKEEFPVGDLEIAIKSASVTSSMRNEIRPEHPLQINIEGEQRASGLHPQHDDEMVNYMGEYEMTRDERKVAVKQRYPPEMGAAHQPVESPVLPDPFFNIADSGTGADVTGSLEEDGNISAHELEEPLQISEDEEEEDIANQEGGSKYTAPENEDLESELVPADECDLPVQQSSIRQARITEISQADDQMTETPLFEPLNFNYSAVES